MKKTICFVALAVLMSANVSQAKNVDPEKPAKVEGSKPKPISAANGQKTLFRITNLSKMKCVVYMDGDFVNKMESLKRLQFNAYPGKHTIRVVWENGVDQLMYPEVEAGTVFSFDLTN